MSIWHLEQSKILRREGGRIGRAGMSERVIIRVKEFQSDPTYKNAMRLAGQLKAIAQAARCDYYWDEKTTNGYVEEIYAIQHYQLKDPKDILG